MNETHQYKAMNDHDSWPMVAQNTSCPRYPLSPSSFSENWIFAIHMAIEVEPMLPQPYPLPDVVTPVHSGQQSGRRSDTHATSRPGLEGVHPPLPLPTLLVGVDMMAGNSTGATRWNPTWRTEKTRQKQLEV